MGTAHLADVALPDDAEPATCMSILEAAGVSLRTGAGPESTPTTTTDVKGGPSPSHTLFRIEAQTGTVAPAASFSRATASLALNRYGSIMETVRLEELPPMPAGCIPGDTTRLDLATLPTRGPGQTVTQPAVGVEHGGGALEAAPTERRPVESDEATAHVHGKARVIGTGTTLLPFVADTGATLSFIGEEQLKLLDPIPQPCRTDKPVEVTVASGDVIRVDRVVKLALEVQLPDTDSPLRIPEVDYYVMPGGPGCVLLGDADLKRVLGISIEDGLKNALHRQRREQPEQAVGGGVQVDAEQMDVHRVMTASNPTDKATRNTTKSPSVEGEMARRPTLTADEAEKLVAEVEAARRLVRGEEDDAVLMEERTWAAGFTAEHRNRADATTRVREPAMTTMDADHLEKVRGFLDDALKGAFDQPHVKPYREEFEELAFQVNGPLLDVFRNDFMDDPPAKVPEWSLRLRGDALPFMAAPRNTSAKKFEFLNHMADLLTRTGKAYFHPGARWASAAMAVAKPKVPEDAPLHNRFRMVSDLRDVNRRLLPSPYPMPDVDLMLDYVGRMGSDVFSVVDAFNGFWNCPLAPDSQEYMTLRLGDRLVTPTRLVQGCLDSPQAFQSSMRFMLTGQGDEEDLWLKKVAAFIDDCFCHSRGVVQAIRDLIRFLGRLLRYGMKVAARKLVGHILRRAVEWVGRMVSSKGVAHTESRLQGLMELPFPDRLDFVLAFYHSAAWCRAHIPRFAELTVNLKDAIEKAFVEGHVTRRSKKEAQRVYLKDLSASTQAQMKMGFEQTRQALAQATRLRHRRDDSTAVVFTDSSNRFYSGVVMSVPDDQLDRPIEDMEMEPLAWVSGEWLGCEVRRCIVDKEAGALVKTFKRCNFLLTDKPFVLMTDARNLSFVFGTMSDSEKAAQVSLSPRVQRWAVLLAGFAYRLVHLEGSRNLVADLLSRPPTDVEEDKALVNPLTSHAPEPPAGVSPAPIKTMAMAGQAGQPQAGPGAAGGRREIQPHPDRTGVTVPSQFKLPTLDVLREAQEQLEAEDVPRGYTVDDDGLLRDAMGRLFVPAIGSLREEMVVVAHAGLGAHRGRSATTAVLAKVVTWPELVDDVGRILKKCWACLRTPSGERVPVPYAHQMHAQEPGAVLHVDYLQLMDAKTQDAGGETHLLVVYDDFSGFVSLFPTSSANSVHTAQSLLSWIANHGVPRWMVADGGAHFVSAVLKELYSRVGMDLHTTTPHASRTHGTAERAVGDVLKLLRRLLVDFRMGVKQWAVVVPALAYALNSSARPRLAGRSPFQIMTGRDEVRPFHVAVQPATDGLKVLGPDRPLPTEVTEMVDAVHARLESWHRDMSGDVDARGTRQGPGHGPVRVQYDVGDVVLVARSKKAAKMKWFWRGPFVIKALGRAQRTFVVRRVEESRLEDAGRKSEWVVHADRIIPFDFTLCDVDAGALLDVTREVDAQYDVEEVLDFRMFERKPQLLLKFEGFEDVENEWVPLRTAVEDVPALVTEYYLTLASAEKQRALKAALSDCGFDVDTQDVVDKQGVLAMERPVCQDPRVSGNAQRLTDGMELEKKESETVGVREPSPTSSGTQTRTRSRRVKEPPIQKTAGAGLRDQKTSRTGRKIKPPHRFGD